MSKQEKRFKTPMLDHRPTETIVKAARMVLGGTLLLFSNVGFGQVVPILEPGNNVIVQAASAGETSDLMLIGDAANTYKTAGQVCIVNERVDGVPTECMCTRGVVGSGLTQGRPWYRLRLSSPAACPSSNTCNLSGRWTGYWTNNPTKLLPESISQNGKQITLTNERRDTSSASIESSGSVIVAAKWGNLRGNITDNCNRITWLNGSVWYRGVAPGTGIACQNPPSLGGAWTGVDPRFSSGNGTELVEQDQNDRNRLVFRNHFAQSSNGHFLNCSTVVADGWEGGLRGTLDSNGSTIRWANGSVWSRSSR